MAMNPMLLLKLKDRFGIFKRQHPKFLEFIKSLNDGTIREGAVLEMKVTDSSGKERITNMKLTADDMETIRLLKELRK